MTTIKLPANTRRIGILSDSHGYIDPRILSSLQNVDCILHAGDIMDKAVIESLKAINPHVYCVSGNNDTPRVWPTQDKEIVTALPEKRYFELNGDKIVLLHGHQYGSHQPDYQKLQQDFSDCRLIIYGHTHKQIVNTHTSPWIINPGASGKIRTKGGPSCLILEINQQHWQIQTIKYIDKQLAA